jgi:hypothetical protein
MFAGMEVNDLLGVPARSAISRSAAAQTWRASPTGRPLRKGWEEDAHATP